jgi:glycosyltransferase involved in cell wall biosynthesis
MMQTAPTATSAGPRHGNRDQPLLSVIIPTHNRASSLARTLEALRQQTLPADCFEVLVVDNASSPDTAAVVGRFADAIPVRHVCEPHLGLHYARHCGARHAASETLVYIDDDVICEPGYLACVCEAFGDPAVGCLGGRVVPQWEAAPPEWLLRYPGALALLDRGPAFRELHSPEDIYGCNFAIRRELLFRLGGFNPELIGSRYVGNGESGLVQKIYEAGARVFYSPHAIVKHCIPSSRLSLEYMKCRFENQGAADAYTAFQSRPSRGLTLLRLPLLALSFVAYAVASRVARTNSRLYYHAQLYAAYRRSRLDYELRLVFSPEWRAFVQHRDWINAAPHPGLPQ